MPGLTSPASHICCEKNASIRVHSVNLLFTQFAVKVRAWALTRL
jgi:hypothetical protein